MIAGHERYADWDGAYVLGALTAAEREEYERHLAQCPDCTREVAELLPLPGLLGRVDDADREALLAGAAPAAPPAGLEERLLDAARAESETTPSLPWWRRTRTQIGVGLAAAAATVLAVVVPLAIRDEPTAPQTSSVTLQQNVANPLSATVALTSTDWGTRIDMTCTYADWGEGPERQRAYGLYVIDHQGQEHQVSTWLAGPGETAHTTGSIDLAVDKLRSVEVRAADGKTVLLSADI
ncbi:zf-HC2 domain-containing protein [Nocardioides sp. CER19]|uniref:zf-HC2 domain-containing protein n=1 Tax=Nocardioides sp. CER19 TaxID=3038538 RepID=UPI00244C1DB8|nr:zf-HC2 domain-containing protein [Nocardioides sp. CER19]MDH2413374.1 zf-HC2 domain-containing protein [Nocardioides sp. CER19]